MDKGWVIERVQDKRTEFWVASATWSTSLKYALFFAREEDAKRAAGAMLYGEDVRFSEREF